MIIWNSRLTEYAHCCYTGSHSRFNQGKCLHLTAVTLQRQSATVGMKLSSQAVSALTVTQL